jgi:WD40 repeat protein
MLMDTKSAAVTFRDSKYLSDLSDLAYSSDGAMLVTCGPGFVRVLDAQTFEERSSLAVPSPLAVAVSPDNERVIAVCSDATVRLWDARTGDDVMTLRHESRGRYVFGEPTFSVEMSADGRHIVSGNREGIVHVWTAIGDSTELTD